MSLIASTITKACFATMLIFAMFGLYNAKARESLTALASHFFHDGRVGEVTMMLTLPILIATSVAALLTVQKPHRTSLVPLRLNRWQVGALRPAFQRVFSNHGDGNFDFYAVAFLLIPLSVTSFLGIRRMAGFVEVKLPLISLLIGKLDKDTASSVTEGAGNIFGIVATLAMAFVLIPASKYGPIMKLFGWSHTLAIRLHIWAGRAIVMGSVLHTIFHTIRWKFQVGGDIQAFLFPPRQCWTGVEGFTPNCNIPGGNCKCHTIFVYFSGTLAVLFLIIVFITSSQWVRRKCYSFFMMSHVLVSPLYILMLIFHWNGAILYTFPSILYYLATTLPTHLEHRRNVGVNITAVDVIGTNYISLTFEASHEAVQAFRPGMYTKLSVPSISNVAHPFTLVRVPGCNDQLRIIFKAMGPFTNQLAALLESEVGIPTIQMDGLHGCPNRMDQLRDHDVNVIVAGGIGVAPFLPIIGDAVASYVDGEDIKPGCTSVLQHLSMHWACRDSSLMEYIRREYLNDLEGKRTHHCDIQINLYQTGSGSEIAIKKVKYPADSTKILIPFRLPRFAPSATARANLVPFLALSAILWPGLVITWYCYAHLDRHNMSGRANGVIALSLYCVAASFVFTRILPYSWFGKSSDKDHFKLPGNSVHSSEEEQPINRSYSREDLDEEMKQVTLEVHDGRPDLELVAAPMDRARWPAFFSCGPVSLVNLLFDVVETKSHDRNAVEPSRQSPLITVYDEAFHM